MALILNMDTSTDYASIALAMDGKLIESMRNPELRDHASWIHQAMRELLIKCGYTLPHLQAIAVTGGPGSYTGLRIGMSTAKGLCYVLNIPLIIENTLKVMAASYQEAPERLGGNGQGSSQQAAGNGQMATANIEAKANVPLASQYNKPETTNRERKAPESLLVPMIDARRMEVFTAIYDHQLNVVMTPKALILTAESFDQWKDGRRLIFFGSGSKKFESIVSDVHFEFKESIFDASALAALSYEHFLNKDFADLAYAEPFYLKEFFSTGKK
jgi:tRNA threonylcarbamoyladenosine biosynthesis protein TsaB